MAADIPLVETASEGNLELEEADLDSSLSRLQEIHLALRNLRETIPRLMESMVAHPDMPEQLQMGFSETARNAAIDLKSFARIMEDPRSRQILGKVKESKANNSQDITNWLVTEHEDWLEVKKEALDEENDYESRDLEVAASPTKVEGEDMRFSLERFRESHPSIEASYEEDARIIRIYLPSAHIHFEITSVAGGGYEVITKEKTNFHKSIIEEVKARPKPNDLDNLLNLLASYINVKSNPCVKCGRLLNQNAQFPIKRSRKRVKTADGRYETSWHACHTDCI